MMKNALGSLMEIIAKVVFPTVAVAIIMLVSMIVLIPQMTHPVPVPVLLDETVTLTDDFYEREFHLQFADGDKISVRLCSYGQPIDFKIIDPNETIIDEGEIINEIYERHFIVTMDGSYTFYVGASTGNPKVRISIVKQ